MSRIALLFLLLFPVLATAGELPEVPGFLNNAQEAVDLAAAKDQPLFLFLTTDWCSWCRRLEKDVFADPAFQAGSAHWVKLRIDAEKADGPDWAKRFHVSGFPTLILLNSQAEEIDRVSGYLPMPTFLETFLNYEKGIGTLDALQEQLAEFPDQLEIKMQVAQKFDDRGQWDRCEELLHEILETDPTNTSGVADDAAAAVAMAQFRQSSDVKVLEALLTTWPGIEAGPQIYNMLVGMAAQAGEIERVKVLLDRSIQDYPNHPEVLNAYAWMAAEQNWDLPTALEVAQRAVALSDSSANVLDTLSEIYFRMGQKDEALAANSAALLKTPADSYLLQQRERFLNEVTH
jgi:thioredoxin-related protein